MTSEELVSVCAQNNALWCDAVLKAATAQTTFHDGFWQATGKQIPLYPNLITLSPRGSPDLKQALDDLPANAAVKDSFDSLNLGPSGFEKLLTGTWLYRPSQADRKPVVSSDWQKVLTTEALGRWLHCWNKNEKLHGVFPIGLLKQPGIEFAMISNGEGIKAGCVLNHGPKNGKTDIIGLTNIFHRKKWLYGALHGLLEPYPHHPVCTYETDEQLLPVYRQLGFQSCGPMSVWIKKQSI